MFWGQFCKAIDNSAIAPITKFTYLLELLEPKVKVLYQSPSLFPRGLQQSKSHLRRQMWQRVGDREVLH